MAPERGNATAPLHFECRTGYIKETFNRAGRMAKDRNRRREASAPTPFEQARDEMFQQIIQCGVLQAAPEHQIEWLDETMAYLSDRYHELQDRDMAELKTLGTRFCQPPKARVATEEPTEEPAGETVAA